MVTGTGWPPREDLGSKGQQGTVWKSFSQMAGMERFVVNML